MVDSTVIVECLSDVFKLFEGGTRLLGFLFRVDGRVGG